jgi:hypothetical protein
VTVTGAHRADRGLLQLVDHGVLLRSLPNLSPLHVQRRVDCRGALVVAKQRIHVGIVHAGRTLTVEAADTTWRVYDDDGLLAEVARTTTKSIARFKVHKPEPPRPRRQAARIRRTPSGQEHKDEAEPGTSPVNPA